MHSEAIEVLECLVSNGCEARMAGFTFPKTAREAASELVAFLNEYGDYKVRIMAIAGNLEARLGPGVNTATTGKQSYKVITLTGGSGDDHAWVVATPGGWLSMTGIGVIDAHVLPNFDGMHPPHKYIRLTFANSSDPTQYLNILYEIDAGCFGPIEVQLAWERSACAAEETANAS